MTLGIETEFPGSYYGGSFAENPNMSFIALKKTHEYYMTPFGNQKKL